MDERVKKIEQIGKSLQQNVSVEELDRIKAKLKAGEEITPEERAYVETGMRDAITAGQQIIETLFNRPHEDVMEDLSKSPLFQKFKDEHKLDKDN